ncbi:probable disease resistance protein At1g15890 [Eutrema salsugineum]|nr:probable disease resistance protein At1g15890 [Eutrema salsugineum]
METNLEALGKAMKTLEGRRNDLLRSVDREEDRGLQRLDEVQDWFSRVEGLGSQVNGLLEARSTETQRLCLLNYWSEDCVSSYEYGEKVFKKLEEAEKLLSEGVFPVLARETPVPKVEKMHIQTTVGLDEMVKRVWNCLMKNGRRTLGLYGMGGVGKTTLLARINDELFEENNGSYYVMWVMVSKDFENKGIQDQILQRLHLDKELEQKTEKEKASLIYNLLMRRKFVLLMDDLWSEVDLNRIGVPPLTEENGSKLVFTTRSKEVCKDMKADEAMQVNCLSWDEAWDLFQKEVGETTLKSHQDIPRLAREVARRCRGLPLALCVIGKTMAYKETVQEWHHAIEVLNSSRREFPGMEENILPILKFSYDWLKDEKVKLCFLYYSLFPEDCEMEKDELIEYWICEKFIDGNRDEYGVNNQGHDIIGSLVRAHLLKDGTKVKMHEVIREMALWIISNFGKHKKTLCVKNGEQSHETPKDIDREIVRRISLMSNHVTNTSCISNLSTLLFKRKRLANISGGFFPCMPALVVLDLSENESLSKLPEDISHLGSLEYLNLYGTGIKSLPVGLKELRKLIYLNLEYSELQCIDGIVGSLLNLQVLKLYCSDVYVDEALLKELQLLEHLKLSTLCIRDAKILESIQGVAPLAKSIQTLRLSYISSPRVTLYTPALSGLQRLEIRSSEICEIKIDWEDKERGECSPCFKQLSHVSITKLEGPTDLTWLLFAQNLRALDVYQSSSIENIIDRNKAMKITRVHPNIVVPLGNLESLQLSMMDELRSICVNSPALPKLSYLKVFRCPKLPEDAIDILGDATPKDFS